MQLLSLTLKGFRGIRDGLGLDALTLDFEALCDGAELVAIVGANGRGKTTVLDNNKDGVIDEAQADLDGDGVLSAAPATTPTPTSVPRSPSRPSASRAGCGGRGGN